MANDVRRLKEEANIQDVLDFFNVEYIRRGSAYFLLCYAPGHVDSKATNCYFKEGWSNVYCTSCGASMNVIDTVMHFGGLNFGEACDVLWEISGCPDWYYEEWNGKKTVEVFNLSKEEANFIGIQLPLFQWVPVSLSPFRTPTWELKRNQRETMDGEFFVVEEKQPLKWSDMMSEDDFKEMVCRNVMLHRQNIMDAYEEKSIEREDAVVLLKRLEVLYARANKGYKIKKAA